MMPGPCFARRTLANEPSLWILAQIGLAWLPESERIGSWMYRARKSTHRLAPLVMPALLLPWSLLIPEQAIWHMDPGGCSGVS